MTQSGPAPTPAPSGATFTFLFTDIEGSTRLWERSPDAMRVALARHDALLREAIQRHEGHVFTTAGDAFCAAFATASAALAATLDAQHAIVREPWPEGARIKVRMALHTGAAELRDNDYFGAPLNRVARLLAAGYGGQVLLSLGTRELVRDSLPAGVALRDMGERRLKDLIRPERVYELVAPGLPADFPPLKTLDARPHNLPVQATRFVGRESEMRELRALLGASRLVTMTGAGGAGKTRLALQLAAEFVDDYADGVWLVELASLADSRLVAQAAAAALGLKEQPGIPLADTVVRALRDKELLVLLDNCEHLVGACAELCQALLSSCARVRILATSRETLRIAGEAAYRVPSLPTPDPRSSPRLAALTQYAAVQLFIDRALAVNMQFRVSNANAPAVANICHRLDGIPLAIELAAARLRLLSAEELNHRLDQRFELLTRGSRTALPRQQTLRALIDWSYDLLTRDEQALFRRLAIFAGGFTLEAVERVCSGDGCDEGAVLDLVAALADKSLVAAEERGGATRYRMLETVREYARNRLEEEGDDDRWRAAHLAFFVALAEEAEPQLTGAAQQAWLDRLETEHDNLRAALAWSAGEPAHGTSGLQLAGALWWFWQVRGYLGEGRGHLSRLIATASIEHDATARAKALNGAGTLAWQQGDYTGARALIEESLEIRRTMGDRRGVARALSNLGNVARDQGDYDAASALQGESLGIRRELGDQWGVAASLCNLGLVANDRGDYLSARAQHEEALSILRELGDQRNIGGVLNNLGEVAIAQGDYDAARRHYEEGLAIFRTLGDRRGISITLTGLGQAAMAQGDIAAARTLHAESLAMKHELADRRGIAISLESLASIELASGAPGRAAQLWGGAERMRQEIEAPLPLNERRGHDEEVAAARAASGDAAAFDRAWADGRATTIEALVEYARAGAAEPGSSSVSG